MDKLNFEMKDCLAAGVFRYDLAHVTDTVDGIAKVAAAFAAEDAVNAGNDWNYTARAAFQLIYATSLSLYQKLEECGMIFDNCVMDDENAATGYKICRTAEMRGLQRNFKSA
jgi:nucleoside-diphosphate-sugar epimerase